MNDDILIDRENELKVIADLMEKKRNIFVFGQEGVGKSVIIHRILVNKIMDAILLSEKSSSLKESLINIIISGRSHDDSIGKNNILSLKKILYRLLNKKYEYVIFDHVGRVGPKFYSFLTYLMDKNIPLLIIGRGLDKQNIGHLRMALYDFEKIEIKNFNNAASNILIGHFINEFCIKLTKEAEFKQAVFDHSKGNPKIIKTLCSLARDVKYKRNNSLDVHLMDLDRRISETVVKQCS